MAFFDEVKKDFVATAILAGGVFVGIMFISPYVKPSIVGTLGEAASEAVLAAGYVVVTQQVVAMI